MSQQSLTPERARQHWADTYRLMWIVLAIWVIVAGMGVGRQLFYMITTEL